MKPRKLLQITNCRCPFPSLKASQEAKRSFKNCRRKTKRVLAKELFIRDAKCQASEETDLENGTQVLQRNSDFGMENFKKQIQEAEIQVDKLSGLLINLKTLLRDANEETKSVKKASEIKAIKKQVEEYIDDVGKIAHNVRGKLQVITIDNLLLRQMPGCQKGTASDRARMNITNVLTKKFMEPMIEFETLRQAIQDDYCEVLERRGITVTGTGPDESMIDHLIETGNSEEMFQSAFEPMGQDKVIGTTEGIQEQLDAVKEMEKRLSELHQIYLDTAVLMEGQAKILDNIENQATNAVGLFQSRIDTVQTAKRLQKKSRKYMMISIILLLVIGIITGLSG